MPKSHGRQRETPRTVVGRGVFICCWASCSAGGKGLRDCRPRSPLGQLGYRREPETNCTRRPRSARRARRRRAPNCLRFSGFVGNAEGADSAPGTQSLAGQPLTSLARDGLDRGRISATVHAYRSFRGGMLAIALLLKSFQSPHIADHPSPAGRRSERDLPAADARQEAVHVGRRPQVIRNSSIAVFQGVAVTSFPLREPRRQVF